VKKKSEKKQQAEELRAQLATVSTVILSTFQGITVEDDTKLRRQVEAAGGKYQVVKNTVAERAGEGTPAGDLLKNLKGTNSIAYTATDPVALAKILTKVAKDVPAFKFRAGWVEGKVISIQEIGQLATRGLAVARGLPVRAVVLSAPVEPDASTGQNAPELTRLGIAQPLAVFPRTPPSDPRSIAAATAVIQWAQRPPLGSDP